MAELDAANAAAYQAAAAFASKWQAAIVRWGEGGSAAEGLPVLVHHQSFAYLSHWLGLKRLARSNRSRVSSRPAAS